MVAGMTGNESWTANATLVNWLAAQKDAFAAWEAEVGGVWDFTMDSLDRLEEAIRDRFTSYEEIQDAEDSPFVQVAYWYFGEVFVRNHAMVWQRRPTNDPSDRPFIIGPGDDGLDEDDDRPTTAPDTEIPALFLRDPDNHLRDALEGWL